MTAVTADLVVIGAGPAGCVFALRMTQLGFDVCLVERTRFPRSRVGESLTPGVLPLLASVGAAAAVERAGCVRVHAVDTNWDGEDTVRHDPRAEGRLVDRGALDAALLAQAAAVGVRVLHPAQVRDYVRTPDGWRVRVEMSGATMDLRTSFLADATGRSARLGGRRRAMGPRTFALYGYWTGARLPDRPRIEAGEDAWYWGVPIPDGTYNTLVFVDAARVRAERRGSLDDRLRALLAGSALGRDVRGATLRRPARAADATPYLDETCVGARHIRIGDAALALDPLSSSGVQKAIQTALAAAIVANTLLRRPAAAAPARRFYRHSLREAAARHRRWAAGHYATVAARVDHPFWTVRAAAAPAEAPGPAPRPPIADDDPVQLSPDARWEEVPCLGERFVEVRPALRHPQLDGPVAYLGGQHLAALLRNLPPGLTSRQLAQAWSRAVPLTTGLSIARWLAGHGVLERCAPGP